MTLWQERGGVPLLTVVALLLCVCAGAAVTVATYREEAPEVTVQPPPTTERPQRAIRLEDLAAELASALAAELDLTPAEEDRIAEIVTDAGESAVIVETPPSGTTPPSPPSTTTTTTTTTSQPPRPPLSVPSVDELLPGLADDYVPS